MVCRRILLVFLALCVVPLSVFPQADEEISFIEGRVVIVHDGDHISVRATDGKVYSIRIQGVDAPELDQAYGKRSRKRLSDLVLNKEVRVIVHKRDMYDRYVGTVFNNGVDVGLRQIESGMAWHFKRFSGEQSADIRARYARAELKARNDRAGLWSDRAPIPPWEFREEDFAADPDPDVEDAAVQAAAANTTPPAPSGPPETKPSTPSGGRTYIRGPRGGCYYVNDRGTKIYVRDKSLCGDQ